MRKLAFSSIAALVIFLASANLIAHNRRIAYINIPYKISDDVKEKKIRLYYKNVSKKSACIGAENWPDKGHILSDGNSIYVTVSGKKFYLKENQDYCPKCQIKVRPGKEVSDYLDYSEFSIPKNLESFDKRLHLTSIGYICK